MTKRYLPTWGGLLLLMLLHTGCQDDFFDKQPLDAVSDGTFWQTEGDARLALVGCYYTGAGWSGEDFWTARSLLYLDLMAGNGSEKELIPDHVTDGTLTASYWVTTNYWQRAYEKITTCNNFLDHIGEVTMDEGLKAMMVAEVRTIRAYQYFNLALFYGDVPLVERVLSIDEANQVTRTPQAEVWAFVGNELSESAAALPASRPDSENGRLTSGAALAILGRLQMARQQWSEAAATYKQIIDSGVYTIDPNFKELFWQTHELSTEIILSSQYQEDVYGHVMLQYLYPEAWGGWHQFSPYNELAEAFLCTDGQPIETSPLYNPDAPYENRDPRLDYTLMISDRTTFKGQTFVSRPDSDSPDRFNKYNWSGYCINKFMDGSFDGNLMNYGGNFIMIRYAEVLLSYLEATLEAGVPVDQTLLDLTINAVRGRTSVQMPAVTTTDPAALRALVRRERRVELAFEGVRYYDILRWGIAAQELNRQYTGLKLTDDPASYTAYPVDDEGYFLYQQRNFKEGINELWPIPQAEIDINKNLTQNPGY
ncbi:Starch-binding associating with outer membrane [Catalinimonas alkaloidigena]|uniref:Starch-binding associating with outer membrane n=1 Tax=Catalinimonas alkaloidigena TaxID=1075417 RepID=A0A1G8YBZ8_9BACT|nr:RagB/SusD family nutrient uptake outer membrane protein [Catalinimonas alkaloidigena]SDK00226.1 Starch-binding associating with outer membrane [Catalinimonas alkaloidigena]